jgi:apolipoprotein N-acyltransferase
MHGWRTWSLCLASLVVVLVLGVLAYCAGDPWDPSGLAIAIGAALAGVVGNKVANAKVEAAKKGGAS